METGVFSDEGIARLKSRGLFLLGEGGSFVRILKPWDIPGNGIPGRKNCPITFLDTSGDSLEEKEPPVLTDASLLGLSLREGKYHVSVWNWVPGPGPGDFDHEYDTEKKAIEMVFRYFFEPNEYFDAYQKWQNEG